MAITETRNLPAQFIEDLGKDYAKQLTATTAIPVDTSKFAPTVAAQDALQSQAATLAGTGVGSFQPFITAAQQQATDAGTTLSGIAGLTGAPTAAQTQAYTSPFQQQVIDTTLAEFDRQRAINEQNIRDQAAAMGSLGAGRTGVQLSEYQSQSGRDRSALEAQLRQQGFQQAQQAAARAQQQQLGLSSLLPQLQQQQISSIGQVGSIQQAQQQAQLQAQQEAARAEAMEPYERLGFYGSGVTGIMGGYPGQYQFSATPKADPLQTALGLGTTFAGIYGGLRR